jgi:hypothetical protein
MCCYNVVQAVSYMHCAHTQLQQQWVVVEKSKVFSLYWGSMYLTSLIQFLSYYTSCGAITWAELRWYIVQHTKLQLIQWVVVEKSENFVIWGSYVTSNISPDSFSAIYISCVAITWVQAEVIYALYPHTQLQLITMSGCWNRKCCLYWGS